MDNVLRRNEKLKHQKYLLKTFRYNDHHQLQNNAFENENVRYGSKVSQSCENSMRFADL